MYFRKMSLESLNRYKTSPVNNSRKGVSGRRAETLSSQITPILLIISRKLPSTFHIPESAFYILKNIITVRYSQNNCSVLRVARRARAGSVIRKACILWETWDIQAKPFESVKPRMIASNFYRRGWQETS